MAQATRSQVMRDLRLALKEMSAAIDVELRERDERKQRMVTEISFVIHRHRKEFAQSLRLRKGVRT